MNSSGTAIKCQQCHCYFLRNISTPREITYPQATKNRPKAVGSGASSDSTARRLALNQKSARDNRPKEGGRTHCAAGNGRRAVLRDHAIASGSAHVARFFVACIPGESTSAAVDAVCCVAARAIGGSVHGAASQGTRYKGHSDQVSHDFPYYFLHGLSSKPNTSFVAFGHKVIDSGRTCYSEPPLSCAGVSLMMSMSMIFAAMSRASPSFSCMRGSNRDSFSSEMDRKGHAARAFLFVACANVSVTTGSPVAIRAKRGLNSAIG